MKTFESIVKKFTGIVSLISHVGFLFIMVLTVCDIIIRYVTGSSILGVYEIVERVMICAVFASFAYTQTEHGHVQITLLTAKYPPKIQFISMALNNVISAVASIMVAYAAYRQGIVAYTSNYTTGVLKIPLFPFYWVEIVAMVVLCIAFLLDMVKNIVALFNKDMAAEVQSEQNG